MARPRAADHDQQRAGIRHEAVQAFASLGYASASMADLAQACQVSKATLYHYFRSKDAILFEALDGYTRRLRALAIDHAPAPDDTPAQCQRRLKGFIRALLHEYGRTQAYHISLLNDVKFLPDEQRRQVRDQERQIVQRVADLIDRAFPGRLPPDHRSAGVLALLGMLNFTFAWYAPDGALSPDALADLMIELWWHGLKGMPASP